MDKQSKNFNKEQKIQRRTKQKKKKKKKKNQTDRRIKITEIKSITVEEINRLDNAEEQKKRQSIISKI